MRHSQSCSYLDEDDIIQIHDQLIAETGGLGGVLSLHSLSAAVHRPASGTIHYEFYPTILEKAAVLYHSVATVHAFNDGNKRTAATTTGVFLVLNGFRLSVEHHELVAFTLRIVEERLTWEHTHPWLVRNVVELPDTLDASIEEQRAQPRSRRFRRLNEIG